MEIKTIDKVDKDELNKTLNTVFNPEPVTNEKHQRAMKHGRDFTENIHYRDKSNSSPFQLHIFSLLEALGRLFGLAPALSAYPLTHDINPNEAKRHINESIKRLDVAGSSKSTDAVWNFGNATSFLSVDEQKRLYSMAIDTLPDYSMKQDMKALFSGNFKQIIDSPRVQEIAEKQAKAQEMLDKIQTAANEIKARDAKIAELSGEIFLLNLGNQSLVEQQKSKPFGAPKSDIMLLNTIDFDLKKFNKIIRDHRIDLDVFQFDRLQKINDFREQLASVDSRFHSASDVSQYIRLRAEFLDSLPGIEWEKGTEGHMKLATSELGLS